MADYVLDLLKLLSKAVLTAATPEIVKAIVTAIKEKRRPNRKG